jgi:hypothetical protein
MLFQELNQNSIRTDDELFMRQTTIKQVMDLSGASCRVQKIATSFRH